ncbi:hypothetical protein ACIO7M_12575 [Streptomyces toxytricini]|uniref:Uncharacterized protein n=1 Tax=Streptomyces toxytricini TaxID=67369 RepID=A0ABW8EH43_STRT5
MTERRALGTGPRPVSSPEPPAGGRRGRLAAELADAAAPRAAAEPTEAAALLSPGRRRLGTGTETTAL